jgi:hypothetical protein
MADELETVRGNRVEEPEILYEERAAAGNDPEEAGCPIERGYPRGICGRKLHKAPDGVDNQPVCLMHSKDSRKRSGPLFKEFWRIFELVLEEAGEGLAEFDQFSFPELNLAGRTFEAYCRFDGATFTQNADFSHATFTQKADFTLAAFMQNAILKTATFWQHAVFCEATFSQDADFSGSTFTWNADFSRANFMRGSNFANATFTQKARFYQATFTQDANFPQAKFAQEVGFGQATFTQSADFSFATFVESASFFRATFTQNGLFVGTRFYRTADWTGCRFFGQAEFRRTEFKSIDNGTPSGVFTLAEFAKPEEVVFDGVDLSRALFINCDVSEFWFTSSVEWAKRDGDDGLAVFEEIILLDARPSEIQQQYGGLNHRAIEQIYHQLKKNYDARLDYRQANDFHFGEMEMRRLEPRTCQRLLKPWGRLRPRLGPEAWYKYASDYGNSFAKPAWWLAATLLAAALCFPIPGLEQKQLMSGQPRAYTYLKVWDKRDTWTSNLWTEAKLLGDSFIASVDTASFQRNAEYTPAYPWGRVLAIVETLLTSTLFALFLLAIRRQFKR